MKKIYRLTQAGVDELKAEHQGLVAQRGPLAERIKAARELGDLSENAEYQSARGEQDRLESRIGEIDHILQNSELIKKPANKGSVRLGSTVSLKTTNGKEKEFQIVGTVEADPLQGKVSDESPIGKALLGKKVGDSVEIKTPSEKVTYKISVIS